MGNLSVFHLLLAAAIIFGAVRSGHASCTVFPSTRCKDDCRKLKENFERLKTEMETTRTDLKQRKENNQLTKEYLLTAIEGLIAKITALKEKVDNFCSHCNWDKCIDPETDIRVRMNERINKLQQKLEEYKNTEDSVLIGEIITEFEIDTVLAFDYTSAVG